MTFDEWKQRLLAWMESSLQRQRRETAELERLLADLRQDEASAQTTNGQAETDESTPTRPDPPELERAPSPAKTPPPSFLAKSNGHGPVVAPSDAHGAPGWARPNEAASSLPDVRHPESTEEPEALFQTSPEEPKASIAETAGDANAPDTTASDTTASEENSAGEPDTLPGPDMLPDPDEATESPGLLPGTQMLLLGVGSHLCGFPWDEVMRVSLAEDLVLPPSSPDRHSLAALLQQAGESIDASEDEVYAVAFRHDGGEAFLTCERIGEFLDPRTPPPEMSYYLQTRERAGRQGPTLLPIEPGPAPASAPVNGQTPEADPPSSMSAPVVEESIPEPVRDPSDAPVFEEPVQEPVGEFEAAHPVEEHEPEPVGEREAAHQIEQDEQASVGEREATHQVEQREQETTVSSDPTPPVFSTGSSLPSEAEPVSSSRSSALVAIRYLPARVSVTRALRQAGWEARELADLSLLSELLRPDEFDAVFLDISEKLPDAVQEMLEREDLSGSAFVGVGSRLRMGSDAPPRPLSRAPRLFFPFPDEEARKLIRGLAPRRGEGEAS